LTGVDPDRVRRLLEDERRAFAAGHPRSRDWFQQAQRSLFGGVPMSWMLKWAGGFPVVASEARGAQIIDLDGHRYVDLCLGDTGAMAGHAPPATVRGDRGAGATRHHHHAALGGCQPCRR